MKYIIGIDPGISGAYAVLDFDTFDLVSWGGFPIGIIGTKTKVIDCNSLFKFLNEFKNDSCAIIEQVSARPGQGVTSMFTFGRSLGAVEGVLSGLQIPIRSITPQKWKKAEGLISKDKDASRLRVNQIYPKTPFPFKKDNGITDAILIARNGKQFFL